MKSILSKISVLLVGLTLIFMGTAFAADTTAPEISINKNSGSTLESGTRLVLTVIDNESNVTWVKYSITGFEDKEYDINGSPVTVTLPALTDQYQTYTIYVQAKNADNVLSAKKKFVYYVEFDDTTAPTITVSKPSGSEVYAGEQLYVDIQDDETKVTNLTVGWVKTGFETYMPNKNLVTVKLPVIGSVPGTYRLKVNATNAAGVSTGTKYFDYYLSGNEDNEKPTVTASPIGTVPNDTIVKIIARDNENLASIRYRWDYTSYSEKSISGTNYSLQTNVPENKGIHYLYVEAIDAAENTTGVKQFLYNVTIKDEVKPSISANPASGSTINPQSTIILEAIDNEKLATVKYSWDSRTNFITKTTSARELDVNVTAPSSEGTHYLYAEAIDASGNTTGVKTFIYYVVDDNKDELKPSISANPASGSTINPQSTIILEAIDYEKLAMVKYSWDSRTNFTTKTTSARELDVNVTAPSSEGTHYLYAEAIDASDNTTGVKTFIYYVVDDNKDEIEPSISANPASGSTINPQSTIILKAIDNEKLATVKYSWDSRTNFTTKTTSARELDVNVTAPSSEGTHYLYAEAIDASENTTGVKTFIYYVEKEEKDSESPTVTANPGSGSTLDGGDKITLTARDDVSLRKMEYYWNNDSESISNLSGTVDTLTTKVPNEDGTHKLYVTVTDNSGKTSGRKTFTYYVDESDNDGDVPEVDADPDGGDVEYGDRITITAEDDDGIDYVEYYWDDDDDGTTKRYADEFTVRVPSEDGKHYLYVRAKDEDGNTCDYERFTYNVEENDYPGNPDIEGELNKKIRTLRVEIRNADDKIKFEPEEDILYYVDYYNGSSSKVKNAKIIVDLPTYLEASDSSDDGKISSNSRKITWELGTLDSGDTGRVSFKASYTSDSYNEKILTVPAKIYSGSSLKDTSTVRNMIYCENGNGTGTHSIYCVGYPDKTFRANGNITRAELAAMVANIEGISSTYRGQFADVDLDHWGAKAIQACVEKGYVNPTGYNTFNPTAPATRGELAYAIAAILEVEDLEPIYIYASDLMYSDARCSMEQLLRLGIMEGYSNGTARPNNLVTRAEAVTIINNYLFRGELMISNYGYSNYNSYSGYNPYQSYNSYGNIMMFVDLNSSHWAYGHIMEATSTHRYERTLDGNEIML